LFRALHRAGLASSPVSVHRADGLLLTDVLITAVAHCAPPQNRLTAKEIANCSVHFARVLAVRPWKAILCLGSVAWYQTLKMTGSARSAFGHGAEAIAPSGAILLGCYHPSQQNTFTGRLTEAMLDQIVGRFATIGR
jgi:uracil-DNA glycosylase family 4